MKSLLVLLVLVGGMNSAQAIARPDGYVLTEQCAQNTSTVQPVVGGNIVELCFAHVVGGLQGVSNQTVLVAKNASGYEEIFEITSEVVQAAALMTTHHTIEVSQIGHIDQNGMFVKVLFHRGVFGKLEYLQDDTRMILSFKGQIDGEAVETGLFDFITHIQ